MICVQALVERAGNDGAAHEPYRAFREWCRADLARAREVVDAAFQDDALAGSFLSFALEAGSFVDIAKEFVSSYSDKRQLAAVCALGRCSYSTASQANEALSAILNAQRDCSDDALCANSLVSALTISNALPAADSSLVQAIVRLACEAEGAQTRFFCGRMLWQFSTGLSRPIIQNLLNVLSSLDPSEKGTIRELDLGLQKLLKTDCADLAIDFVETLLISAKGGIRLAQLDRFGKELSTTSRHHLGGVVVRWLLLGESVLCDGLHEVMREVEGGGKVLELDLKKLNLSAAETVFLSRKAVGYLFFQPVTAASMLVSALRIQDNRIIDDVRDLLLSALLVNFGGALVNYLDSIDEEDPAYSDVRWALEQNEQYLSDFNSIGEIKELWPSDYQRQIERRRASEEGREIQKMAEKKSVFFGLVKRSTILYGNRTLAYVDDQEGKRRPIEIEMKSFGATIELPRALIVDPVGLDYMLRVFRAERLKHEIDHSRLPGLT